MRIKWIILSVLFVSSGLVRVAEAKTEDLSKRLDRILSQSRIKKTEIAASVCLFSEGQHRHLFDVRSQDAMIPASLTKILTAGATLKYLGPSRKLETQLLSAGSIQSGTLNGPLILRGGGDPGFVSESMWFLVNELVRTGIRQINGDIIVDDSRFDRVRADPSRQEQRVDRAFDAPVGAMSFNWNSINVYVRPAQDVGQNAMVYLDPENAFVTLVGRVKTVAGSKNGLQVERRDAGKDRDVIWVGGEIGINSKELVAYKNITAPEIWSGHNLISFLKQRGITVSGGVKSGVAPAGAKVLAKAESKPVSLMVTDMMKFSNNFVAEMLVKNIAAEAGVQPATLSAGVDKIREYLVGLGLDKSKFQILNPSGFSRENKMTATDMHEVLVKMHEDFSLAPEAMASFPLAATDGTLKNRMRQSEAQGRVRAKTGLLNGVAGLAGYAGRSDGAQLAFVFMFNGRPEMSEDARQLFDRWAAELVK